MMDYLLQNYNLIYELLYDFRDKDRKRKVNAIMGSLSNQEGDYKKLTKKKK